MKYENSSRLIVKNLPKHLTEDRLKSHFSAQGVVTDAKIMRKGIKSRLFGFVGFKTEQEAAKAKAYFDKSFIDTSRVSVEFAKPQNDPALPRPWSRHAKGSSSYMMEKGKEKVVKGVSEADGDEIERKKDKFRAFLKVMGQSKEKQSWNDNFTAFMADDSNNKRTNKANDK